MNPIALDHLPVLPGRRDYGIGICGAGGIVNDAHLPAYRKAGFNVAGIFDARREAAERTAARFEIPRVFDSLEQLVADRRVDVVDIAVPATENLGIVEAVSAAGKPMLIQKPLAEDYETARRTVEAITRRGKEEIVVVECIYCKGQKRVSRWGERKEERLWLLKALLIRSN